MNVCEPFIRRPVATSLLMVGVLLFGILGYIRLPVNDLPNVDYPTVAVTANLPGANAETMASAVATPLERQFSTIAGLENMSSKNSLGFTQISLTFSLSRSINDVIPDIQSAITRASSLLPAGMPQPPTFNKVNPGDQPILFLALTSATLPLYQLDEYGENLMAQRISMVNGVAQVQVFGPQKYAVRVQVDPDKLASRGIGIDEVRQAIQKANVNLATGTLQGKDQAFTIQANGQLFNAAAYDSIVVTYRNGSPVRLKDVGVALDSVEDNKGAAWFVTKELNQRSLILAILRQPGTNTVEVAKQIKKLIPEFESYLPPSVKLHILYDRSVGIEESINDVQMTLLIALFMVVMVIFLFLRNLSATIIPSLALPICILGTFGVMYLLDYTMDNLSLMALILSVGLVVDDAIVMLENIVRHLEKGEKPLEAALKGSKEIGFTIVSMTLSLVAVFVPLLFMGGLLGRLFREFSVTICMAILISGLVSLTLTPMLCSRFLQSHADEKHGPLYNAFERFFSGLRRLYEVSLDWVLGHRLFTLMMSLVILVVTGLLMKNITKGFIPDSDSARLLLILKNAQGTSFDGVVRNQKIAAEIVRQDPNVEAFFSGVGGERAASLGGQNVGRIFIHLKPRSERKLDMNGVKEELRAKLAFVPGLIMIPQVPPTVTPPGGSLTQAQYELALQSPDLNELYKAVPVLEAKMRALPQLQDVNSDLQLRNPEVHVGIDRDKAASLGISADQIESALQDSYGPHWISTIYAPNDQYKVLLELNPKDQADPTVLSKLYIRSTGGQLVPMGTLTRQTQDVGPQTINHLGQFPSSTISFNLRPGVSLSEAVDKVQEVARQTLPPMVTTRFQGTAQAFQDSLQGSKFLLMIAILIVYLILGILYESYIHPVTILWGLPSAGLGALVTLYLFKTDLNVLSFVGLIMLIGIVKKNAIMQIDFALAAQRNEGKSPMEAIREGCLVRFRPIMMTTMAALFGTLPIAVGFGAGGGSRQPLGLTVVGGLLFSQLVTLYITPVIYTYLDELQKWVRSLGGKVR